MRRNRVEIIVCLVKANRHDFLILFAHEGQKLSPLGLKVKITKLMVRYLKKESSIERETLLLTSKNFFRTLS